MKLVAPDYYTGFKCIADKCKHNCCKGGWIISIDEDTLEYYRSVTGPLGDRLKAGIDEKAETPRFILDEQGTCPLFNENGLCDLITELGENSLCQICRDHPRFRNFYGDRTEIGVGLCCEAAGDLILKRQEKPVLVVLEDDGEMDEPDAADISLYEWRDELTAIAQNRAMTMEERADAILKEAEMSIPERTQAEWAEIFLALERLDNGWTDILQEWKETDITDAPALDTKEWEVAFEQLLVYFLYRQLPFALDDGEYEGRAVFCVLCYRIIRDLCRVHAALHGNVSLDTLVDIARQYSAEIEYSDENVDILLDVLFSL